MRRGAGAAQAGAWEGPWGRLRRCFLAGAKLLSRQHGDMLFTSLPLRRRSYVSEEEAGRRLAQVVSDPSLNKSGVYWSWSNDKGAFENQVSEEVADDSKGVKLWEISEKLVGLA